MSESQKPEKSRERRIFHMPEEKRSKIEDKFKSYKFRRSLCKMKIEELDHTEVDIRRSWIGSILKLLSRSPKEGGKEEDRLKLMHEKKLLQYKMLICEHLLEGQEVDPFALGDELLTEEGDAFDPKAFTRACSDINKHLKSRD